MVGQNLAQVCIDSFEEVAIGKDSTRSLRSLSRIRVCGDVDGSPCFAKAELLARREGFAGELRSRCASPAKLAREEESQPEED